MSYVSKIISQKPVRSKYTVGGNGLTGQVQLDTGEIRDVTSCRNVLGVLIHEADMMGAIVVHNKKTAALHKFVEDISDCSGHPKLISGDEDSCAFGEVAYGLMTFRENVKMAINTNQMGILVGGVEGSVVLVRKDYESLTPKVFTLYDFLIWLSKKVDVNMLRYEQIRLFSQFLGYTQTIRLSQSVEAKRFYTKMYMDVAK